MYPTRLDDRLVPSDAGTSHDAEGDARDQVRRQRALASVWEKEYARGVEELAGVDLGGLFASLPHGGQSAEPVPADVLIASVDLVQACSGVAIEVRDPNEPDARYRVHVPAGARDGMMLSARRDPSAGAAQQGARRLVRLSVAPHPLWHLQGDDIEMRVPIAPWEAALGANIDLPTPSGVVLAVIPPGIGHGEVLRIRGRGWPVPERAGCGDLLLRLSLVTPRDLGPLERAAWQRLASASRLDARRMLWAAAQSRS